MSYSDIEQAEFLDTGNMIHGVSLVSPFFLQAKLGGTRNSPDAYGYHKRQLTDTTWPCLEHPTGSQTFSETKTRKGVRVRF